MSYRLEVITTSVADAVRYAGGLMFDRGRAGWRVSVITEDAAQSRALTVLGARLQLPGQLDDVLYKPDRLARTLLMPVDELTEDRHLAAVNYGDEPCAQLLFWGADASESAAARHAVRHDLSPAARSFKTHALRCAGLDTEVERSELFWVDDPLASARFGDLRMSDVSAGGDRAPARTPT